MMPPDDERRGRPRGGTLQTYDIEKEKLSTLVAGRHRPTTSRATARSSSSRRRTASRASTAGATSLPKPEPGEADDSKIDLSGWSLKVNPRDEWKQMLREAWRLQRDFFYDPQMHGVDWNGRLEAVRRRSPTAWRRATTSRTCSARCSASSTSATPTTVGGDLRRGKPVGTGLLAADLDYDPATGFWQIKKIYRGDYPMAEWSSPLARAGPARQARASGSSRSTASRSRRSEDYLARLAGRAGQEVELSINDAPKLDGARRIVVKTVANDTRIRYADWIRETREYVDRASNGQIGYIHLYDMGGLGLRQFARDYPPQWNKRGLIMDDRWNHGGFVAPMILAHLDRKIVRHRLGAARARSRRRPTARSTATWSCLINRQGGSDCETFALGFKDYGLGPVVGTRTWGGWVGIRGDKTFRDGGVTTQPEFGGWDPQGKAWRIEGHGVDPDVELDLPPDGLLHGKDAQLDYAIKELLKEIAKDPRDLKPAPPIAPRPLIPVRETPTPK